MDRSKQVNDELTWCWSWLELTATEGCVVSLASVLGAAVVVDEVSVDEGVVVVDVVVDVTGVVDDSDSAGAE